MTSHMKLSTKLIGSVSTILGLAILLGTCSALVIRGLGQSMDYAVNVAAARRTVAQDLYGTALKMQSVDRAIMLRAIVQQGAGTDDLKQSYNDTATAGRKSLAEYQAMMEAADDRAAFDRVRSAFDDLVAAHQELVQYMEKQQFDQVQKVADEKVMPRAEAITTEAKQLVQHDMVRMQTASDDAKSRSSTGQWMVVVFTLVCLAVGAVIVVIVRSITSVLRDLASTMSDGASQVAAAATQVAAVSQSLAQASSEQAASLEETSASAHDLASMTRKNVEHTQRASESVTETDKQVRSANTTIELRAAMLALIRVEPAPGTAPVLVPALMSTVLVLSLGARHREAAVVQPVVPSGYRNNAFSLQQAAYDVGDTTLTVGYRFDRFGTGEVEVEVDGTTLEVEEAVAEHDSVAFTTDGVRRRYRVDQVGTTAYVDGPDGSSVLEEHARFPLAGDQLSEGSALAPMPGGVVRVAVAVGDQVEAGQVLVVLEAMKMEHAVHATAPGTVTEVTVSEGDQVETGRPLVAVEAEAEDTGNAS